MKTTLNFVFTHRRSSLVITTKIFWGGKYVLCSVLIFFFFFEIFYFQAVWYSFMLTEVMVISLIVLYSKPVKMSFFLSDCFHRAETERGLSRKHIIEGETFSDVFCFPQFN
jgi:hypothetical protein